MPKLHVNGIELYYEVHGQGEPVLLLSGLTADHLMFGFQLPALAPHFQCI
ncbi:MAG: alpha/beta hydrolase fold protein, partial [Firmicutes bacterium]|nr:alpha/beta hydrolase fold protein [Bacillota bacterium]